MKEIVHRVNYFTTAFISLIGISVVSEVFLEDDPQDKIDDGLLFILGLAGIWWYKKTGHKAPTAIGSVVLVIIALVIKIMGIVIEHGDSDALGDDIGVGIALLLGTIFVIWQYFSTRKTK